MPSESKPSDADDGPDRLVLGIDGGGTKTAAVLARCTTYDTMSDTASSKYEILGRGRAGSGNVVAVGFDAVVANLKSAIDAAWDESGIALRPVDLAVFALAGAGLVAVREQISHWIQQNNIAQRSHFTHDAQAVLTAGTPEGWGVALIAGTGSVAMGRNSAGETKVTGGWGYWFGDEGSAFAIGRAGLCAISVAVDGRGPATQLTELLTEHLQVTEPRDMLDALSRTNATSYAIAKVAKVITQAAELGDDVALSIVERASDDLARLVEATAAKLSLGSAFPLAAAGGVLCGSEIVRTELIRRLDELAIEPTSLEFVPEPVIGCVKQAYEDLGR